MIDKNKNFFTTVRMAFIPSKYPSLSERETKDALKYFFSAILLAFILFTLILIPKIAAYPNTISSELESFNEFKVDISTEMTDPAKFSSGDIDLLVDTRKGFNMNRTSGEEIIISENNLYIKGLEGYHITHLKGYKDILANKETLSNILAICIALMLPSILLIAYILYALKYLLAITIITSACFGIAYLLKFKVEFRRLFNIGTYAVAPVIALELLGVIFGFSRYHLHFLLLIIIIILGGLSTGKLAELKHRNLKSKIKIRPKIKPDFRPGRAK